MARVQFVSPIEEIRGSIAGNTYSKNSSGCILRSRRVPSQPITSKQSAPLAALNNLQALFRTLDYSRTDEWDGYAHDHTRTNMFAQETKLSGAQWFLYINTMAQLLGQVLFISPPPFDNIPPAPRFSSFSYNSAKMEITLLDPPPENGAQVMYTTPLNFAVYKIKRQQFRFTGINTNHASAVWNFLDGWKAAHNSQWPPSLTCFGQIQIIIFSILNNTCISNNAMFQSQQIQFP